ncbi:MAG: AAA family ATPase [Deltaproteobacteria bacterium]|nr:AAA family ATPase [Deltaproteobacteria bacterium]
MTFEEVLDQVQALLQQEKRVSYRALKLRFSIDDDYIEGLKDELIHAKRVAVDEEGKVLVWVGASPVQSSEFKVQSSTQPPTVVSSKFQVVSSPQPPAPQIPNPELRTSQSPAGERRQLTVMFIDLVGSTALSQQLDPEEYHARVRAYQTAYGQIIARYDGHIAQYLGDGVLVYFGYPAAHEDDAGRAVHSGLAIVAAVSQLLYTPPLQIRIGIHTGPVVVAEIGTGARTEQLALGETLNIAARGQGLAEPDTVVMSATTYQLVQGLFECQELRAQTRKGISTPMVMYRVVGESAAQTRFEVAIQRGLTPLVGRADEFAVLQRGWEHVKASAGQVILLNGEAGIGKSRLVHELKEQLEHEKVPRIEFRCSPYHQNSAFYPIIDHLRRLLRFAREDTPATKLEKLQQMLSLYRFPQADTVALSAAFLSLPHPTGYPTLTLSPQKQK